MVRTYTLAFATPILFFVALNQSLSQSSYVFSQVSPGIETYRDLVGDVVVPAFDDNGLYTMSVDQPTTLRLFNTDFTVPTAAIASLGEGCFLRIDNDTSFVIIDGAFTYLDSIDATSRRSYSMDGGSSDLIVKYQYKHHRIRSGPEDNFMNVQICFFQRTGVIEIHYGPRSPNNASGYTVSNGPNVGIFFVRNDFGKMYDKLWVNGEPNAPTLDSAKTPTFRALSGIPDEGTIYRFTPRGTTSVDEGGRSHLFEIEPHPVRESFRVDAVGEIEIYSQLGELCLRIPSNQVSQEIDARTFPSGYYIARLITQNGDMQVRGFIKE